MGNFEHPKKPGRLKLHTEKKLAEIYTLED